MRLAAVPLLMVLAAGCTRVTSTDVHTRAIEAQFAIKPGNDGTSAVSGVLKVGLDYVTLGPGDSIVATTGSDTAVMSEERDFWGATSFTTTLDKDAPGAPITITFTRAEGEASAQSSVVLPSRFNLAPMVVPNGSRSSAIRLAWDSVVASNESMSWSASGNCIVGTSEEIPAGATTVIIPGGTLRAIDENAPETCVVSIDVSRRITGAVDPSFASGSAITAVRTLSNSLSLKP